MKRQQPHGDRRYWRGLAKLVLTATLGLGFVLGCGDGNKNRPDGSGGDAVVSPDEPPSPYNLEVTQVLTQASRVEVSQSISVAFEVQNSGTSAVGPFRVGVFLAREDGKDKIPLGQGVDVEDGLKPGKRYTSAPLDLIIPAEVRSGQYFIVAEADPENLIRESDEVDNVGKTLLPLQIVNPNFPDLIIVKPEDGPAVRLMQNSVIPGSPVNVAFTVKNVGRTLVTAFNVGVYLSSDAKLDKKKDVPFGTIAVSALAGDEEKELAMTLNLPADQPLGNYYLLANADDGESIDEGDESDNVGASEILTVRMPPEHFTDLIATDVKVKNQGPSGNASTYYYGDRLEVEASFKNLGDIAAKFFATRVFLSTDRTFDPPSDPRPSEDGGPPVSNEGEDILLTTFNTQGLPGRTDATQTKAREISPTIPTGSYYVILQVDSENSVDESDFELNNIVVLDKPITISGDPPPPMNDTCANAQPLTFSAGGVATVSQSTEYALGDYSGSCGGGSGRDLVYSFTTTEPKSLRVNVSGFNAVVYLRKGNCQTAMDMGLCSTGSRDLYIKTLDPGSYSLFVDGSAADESGPFTLTATQAAPVAAAYTITTTTAAYTDIAATGTLITPFPGTGSSGTNPDSGCINDIPLGFTFPYFENSYTTVQVHADGYVRFGATTCQGHEGNLAFPDSHAPNNIAAAFWDDLGFSGFGTAIPTAKVYTQAMADRFVVQYTDWTIFGHAMSKLNFQIILHTDGNLEYQYLSMVDTTDPMRAMGGTSSGATIGLENSDGSDGYQYSFNSASIMAPMGLLLTKN